MIDRGRIETNNPGWGYYGEAFRYLLRKQYGDDYDPDALTEEQTREVHDQAAERFSGVVHCLTDMGYFTTVEQARDFLDSRFGRHLHDGATFHDGDIGKVVWLGRCVRQYRIGLGSTVTN